MADVPAVHSPDYWQERAEEARARSEDMLDNHTKALMLGIADTYEHIARAYEKIISDLTTKKQP